MEHFGDELDLRSLVWVVLCKRKRQLECAPLPRSVVGPENHSRPATATARVSAPASKNARGGGAHRRAPAARARSNARSRGRLVARTRNVRTARRGHEHDSRASPLHNVVNRRRPADASRRVCLQALKVAHQPALCWGRHGCRGARRPAPCGATLSSRMNTTGSSPTHVQRWMRPGGTQRAARSARRQRAAGGRTGVPRATGFRHGNERAPSPVALALRHAAGRSGPRRRRARAPVRGCARVDARHGVAACPAPACALLLRKEMYSLAVKPLFVRV